MRLLELRIYLEPSVLFDEMDFDPLLNGTPSRLVIDLDNVSEFFEQDGGIIIVMRTGRSYFTDSVDIDRMRSHYTPAAYMAANLAGDGAYSVAIREGRGGRH